MRDDTKNNLDLEDSIAELQDALTAPAINNTHLQKVIDAGTYEPFIDKRLTFRCCVWDAKVPDGKGGYKELGKTPLYKGWKTRSFKHRELLNNATKHGCNVGIRIPKYLLVIDVDPRNGGDESFDWLCAEYDLDPSDWAGQTTGSGGQHYVLRKPEDVPIKKTLKSFPGIEFLSYGFYIIGPGSLHPKTGKPYVWWEGKARHDCPDGLLESLRIREIELDDRPPEKPGRLDADQLEAILEVLDPADCAADNDSWLAIAMDCHYLTNGCPHACGVFLAWCRRDPVYDDDETTEKNQDRWDSFSTETPKNRRIRQGGTLFRALWQVGHADLIPPREDVQEDFSIEDQEPPAEGVSHTASGYEYITISHVPRRRVRWVWYARIASGKLNILAGDPESGKTLLACYIAETITTGGTFPDGHIADHGRVIFLSAEDDVADTLGPRLDAAGADTELCHLIPATYKVKGGRRMLNIGDDLKRIEEVVEAVEDTENPVRMIIVDPLSSYLGKSDQTDTYRGSDVRAVLTPLIEWAAKHDIAVLCIMHLNKKGGDTLLSRVSGSEAFTALSRSTIFAVPEPREIGGTTGRFILGKGKLNIAKDPGCLAYRFESVEVEDEEGTHSEGKVVIDGPVNISIEEAFAATRFKAKTKRGTPAMDRATAFLEDLLESGPVDADKALEKADAEGISRATLDRARRALKIKSDRKGFGKGSGCLWSLPDENGCASS